MTEHAHKLAVETEHMADSGAMASLGEVTPEQAVAPELPVYLQPTAQEERRQDLQWIMELSVGLRAPADAIDEVQIEAQYLLEVPTRNPDELSHYDRIIAVATLVRQPAHVVAEIVELAKQLRAEHQQHIATFVDPVPSAASSNSQPENVVVHFAPDALEIAKQRRITEARAREEEARKVLKRVSSRFTPEQAAALDYPEPEQLLIPDRIPENAEVVASLHLGMLRSGGKDRVPVVEVVGWENSGEQGKHHIGHEPTLVETKFIDAFANGDGKFMAVNEFIATSLDKQYDSRRNEDVLCFRAFHGEIDFFGKNTPPEERISESEMVDLLRQRIRDARFPFAPYVNTSGGKGLHCYWPLTDHILKDEESFLRHQAVQEIIVHMLGADAGAKDCARMLRAAGSRRLAEKPGTGPFVWPVCITGMSCPFEEVEAAAWRWAGEVEFTPPSILKKCGRPTGQSKVGTAGAKSAPKAEAVSPALHAIPPEVVLRLAEQTAQIDAELARSGHSRETQVGLAHMYAKLRDLERVRWGLFPGKFPDTRQRAAVFIFANLSAKIASLSGNGKGWKAAVRRFDEEACQEPSSARAEKAIASVASYLAVGQLKEVGTDSMIASFGVTDELAEAVGMELTGEKLGDRQGGKGPAECKPRTPGQQASSKSQRHREREHEERHQPYLIPTRYREARAALFYLIATELGIKSPKDWWERNFTDDQRDGLIQAYFESGQDVGVFRAAIGDPKGFAPPPPPVHVQIVNSRKAMQGSPLRGRGSPPRRMTKRQKAWRSGGGGPPSPT